MWFVERKTDEDYVLSRRDQQLICKHAIEEYVSNRSEVRATEVADHVEYVTGWDYSPITAARVLGNLGWKRTILPIGSPQRRIKIFRRY